MSEDIIAEVGIDDVGRLYVRPASMSFEHVWRAAGEVNWDSSTSRLVGPKQREWTYADWFRQIVAVVADEYGAQLRLVPETVWSNVPDALRTEINSVSRA